LFELLNEPHGKMSGDWNRLLADTLQVVRESNPTRTVLVGPTYWNHVKNIDQLNLPPDRNLIVAIHSYDPFPFTHQGVSYMKFPVGVTCCDDVQRKQIVNVFNAGEKWSVANGYPLHLGEFGAYNKADMASREAYTRIVRDEAEKRNIGWTYWEFASSFGVFDPKANEWIEPIRRALLD
jgi:endoglucanase